MGRRRSGPRGGTGGPDRAELEGFLDGVRHRLAERRAHGAPRVDLETRTHAAAGAIGAGEPARAESELLAVADVLDSLESDPELREFPRGLVAYDPRGDRGVPTSEEEDAVPNRLLLIERLTRVAAADGLDVTTVRATLLRAQAAYADGDRRLAVSLGTAALDDLDARRRTPTRRGTS